MTDKLQIDQSRNSMARLALAVGLLTFGLSNLRTIEY